MQKQIRYKWLDYSLLKPYSRVTDLFVQNNILEIFSEKDEVKKVITEMLKEVKLFNPELILKTDSKYNLVFFESNYLQDHRLLKKFATISIKDQEELGIDVNFYNENKYKNEFFELFLQTLGVFFLKIKLLREKGREFQKNKAQKILLFSLSLSSKLQNIALALEKFQELGFQDAIIDSAFADIDEFMEIILTYLNPDEAGVKHISLTDEICMDLLEVLLKHRFLFKKKNQFVAQIFGLLTDQSHPLFTILEKIYYQETLIEMQYEKQYEMNLEQVKEQAKINSKKINSEYNIIGF
jgi:hypothetical protein